ncbi:hypothetical protein JOB18_026294 [Solea senegalensis]|uniref:Uncharacterized protein n=1 Tax=Solea senegalensis TaxID=28829 RepID=A0AAV6PRT3_SOLSE|nr:hypothetical protein JOB18_026294 [Solea senegalensis]
MEAFRETRSQNCSHHSPLVCSETKQLKLPQKRPQTTQPADVAAAAGDPSRLQLFNSKQGDGPPSSDLQLHLEGEKSLVTCGLLHREANRSTSAPEQHSRE